jgi:hypothetical protein
VYLDFKAAFDKVPHRRLLNKVWSLGIRGKVYAWIKNFLENRQQRVKMNGTFSGWQTVTSGVPQGSVLGPILFLIFINDLPDVITCTAKPFADDTKLYSVINGRNDETQLQDNINIFEACNWANKWKMIFNTKKCKTMHIGQNTTCDYFMKDSSNNICKIQQVNEEKDLAVIFDCKMTFSKHISSKVNKA